MNDQAPEESKADNTDMGRMTKSVLFHIWKKARVMYDMVQEDDELETWVKNKVREAHDALDEAMRYTEYNKTFPAEREKDDGGPNNYLSNEDKRYPTPTATETGDQFVTRCIQDANMKKRYPESSDRFMSCMIIYNDVVESEKKLSQNPGEKFNDPMQPKDENPIEPEKPILP